MAEGPAGSYVPTPANPTFLQMKTRVARIASLTDAEALTVAGDCINEAIGEWNGRNWKWSIGYNDITLSADDIDYAIQADWRAPVRCQLYNSSTQAELRLDFINPVEFDQVFYERTVSGSPTHYTCWWQKDYGYLMLSVPPSSDFVAIYPTLRHWYFQRLAHLSGSTDTLDVPDEVLVGITHLARSLFLEHYAPERAGRFYQRHQAIWHRVKRWDNRLDFTDFDAGFTL